MNHRDKAKAELIKELQKIQQESDLLKTSYDKDTIERKLVEAALRESEERYRLLFENSGEAILLTNPDGSIYSANTEACRIYGRSEAEICKLGRNCTTDLNDPRLEPALNERKKTGKFKGELNQVRKDGTIFPAEVTSTLFTDSSGNERTSMIIRDISERKLALEALALEKENFRHSLDDSPMGIRIATENGDTIYANKAILNIYGFESLEEFQNIPIKNRYTPESYAESQKRKIQRKNGDLSNTRYQISIVRKNGEIRNLRVLRTEVFWGGLVQFQVMYEDITELKRGDLALRESEARFRSLFESSLLGISIANPDGRLIQANMAYAKMYGYNNPEELLSDVQSVRQLYANPEDRNEVLHSLNRDGFMEPKEFELIKNDGSRFFVLVSASEIRDSNGKLLYNQATHLDLTGRKKIEKELLDSKELLEKLNQHLNEVRENERAAISREIHDELGQSMTALKLDLNRLYNYVSTSPEAITLLDSMNKLISDTIKDVQRISSDLRPGILDELGLVSAIEWYCDEFENRTAIKCTLELENSAYINPQINLTFFRALQEAFTNIIRHAKASSVYVQLQQTDKGTTLTITDNGVGISGGKINSNKSLGLISMRERVKQFKGKIEISSKTGDGTKLTVFIPS